METKKITKEAAIELCKKKAWRPSGTRSSVRKSNDFRFNKADEQAKMPIKPCDQITRYVLDFLDALGIKTADDPVLRKIPNRRNRSYYENMGTADPRDLVWLKFTTDGDLVCVASSNDINHHDWNTSGLIVKHFKKHYDKNFVLAFPLKNLSKVGLKRGEVERGVGEYLIKKGVPILNFYSHRYQFLRRSKISSLSR